MSAASTGKEECLDVNGASERVSQMIFEYAARIGQEQDTRALLGLNADMARDLVGADRCRLWLYDSDAGQLYTTAAPGVDELRIPSNRGIVGACIQRLEPIVMNGASADEQFLNRIDEASGYVAESVLVIPLCASDGTVIGAFQALNKPGGFSHVDVALLGLAGSYSAASIETQRLRKEAEKARLLLRDIEIACEVQAGLLPHHSPAVPGFECAAFFRPAKLVGGDYYDFIESPSGGLAVTLGGVSGKRIPAAVFMASIQASVRTCLLGASESLATVMTDTNASVYTFSSGGRYSTLFCGLLDQRTGALRYVNAGQCAPRLVRYSDRPVKIERLTKGGAPLGLLPKTAYDEGATAVRSGDVLLCFSDGISQPCNAREEFWPESEIDYLLCTASTASPEAVIQRVVDGADTFAAGAAQAVDMTAVAVRVL